MQKFHKKDIIIVNTGKDKNKTGEIQQILHNNKALVKNINIITKHQKPKTKTTKGKIIKKLAPIHLSNISIFNFKYNKKRNRTKFKHNYK